MIEVTRTDETKEKRGLPIYLKMNSTGGLYLTKKAGLELERKLHAVNESLAGVGSCDYSGHEFGAESYPDSVCCEGYLYDADSWDGNGYTKPAPDEVKIPCPRCNKKQYHEYLKAIGNQYDVPAGTHEHSKVGLSEAKPT